MSSKNTDLDTDFLERLESLVQKRAGGSWRKFGLDAGIKQQTFNMIKQGRLPRADNLRRLCEHYGISADWLLFGHQIPHESEYGTVSREEVLYKGWKFDAEVVADSIQEHVQEPKIPEKHLRFFKVSGEAMMPTFVPGDLALVHTKAKLGEGIYAFKDNRSKSIFFRRVIREAGKDRYTMVCDNFRYYPEETVTSAKATPYVKGKVVWYSKKVS